MKLKCLQDTCPETGQAVDMRRCCGAHSWSKPCNYYGRKPWSEYMYSTCEHPGAALQLRDRSLMMPDVEEDSLFCFYDVEKSPEVVHCCGVLAELLKSFWDDGWRV